jgi:DNA polymerase III subunit alpha
MTTFFDDFTDYDSVCPPGVRLPEIKIDDKYYKEYNASPSISNFEFLKILCRNGVKRLGVDKLPNKSEYYDRIKYELKILDDLGFTDYILLNWDILNFCKEKEIPTGAGRGSAAGSVVLYFIDVTKVDPIKHDLYFERFVSKSRAKKTVKDGITFLDGSLLADIDNDIAYEHRQKVISYIESRHPERTSKILTLNTLSSKLCIKECGKIAGGYSESEVNEVSGLIPKVFGRVLPINEAIEENSKFNEWCVENPKIILIAKKIQGLNKNTGVHPSGIAISYYKIEDICPLQKTNDGALVTGYDMNWVSELMVKFDILGLRTLSVVYDICNALDLNPLEISLDDQFIYSELQDLRTPHGLFQIEADANYRVCKKVKPRSMDELSAVIAIARPGALDYLDHYVDYRTTGDYSSIHPLYDSILKSTGGICLYQEQLMRMAVEIGFSLDDAEQIRRIVGKKKIDQMPIWKSKIEQKIIDNNLPHEAGEVLWKVAEDSANYSFNRSHSIAYSTLSAWTIYLKFKYPQMFFVSLLRMTNHEPNPQEEINKICKELPHFGIKLLPPDLAISKMDFSLEGSDIRFGLNSIKGVSKKSLQSILDFRESEMPTKYDIFLSAKQAKINIGVLSALIQAGALSDEKYSRARLVLEAQSFNLLTDREKRNFLALGEKYNYDILKAISDVRKNNVKGDDNRILMPDKRFGTFKKKYDPYKAIYEQNKQYVNFTNWYFESNLLGYSYSTTLVEAFSDDSGNRFNNSLHFNSMENRENGRFIGKVEDSFKSKSRNGNSYIKVFVGDEYGSILLMLIDNRRSSKCSDYLNQGGKVPEKGNIITFWGSKHEDLIFADGINILDDKIYMKLSDLK